MSRSSVRVYSIGLRIFSPRIGKMLGNPGQMKPRVSRVSRIRWWGSQSETFVVPLRGRRAQHLQRDAARLEHMILIADPDVRHDRRRRRLLLRTSEPSGQVGAQAPQTPLVEPRQLPQVPLFFLEFAVGDALGALVDPVRMAADVVGVRVAVDDIADRPRRRAPQQAVVAVGRRGKRVAGVEDHVALGRMDQAAVPVPRGLVQLVARRARGNRHRDEYAPLVRGRRLPSRRESG